MGFVDNGIAYRSLCCMPHRCIHKIFFLWVTLTSWITSTAVQGIQSNCSALLTGSGIIISPNYPLNYPDNINCTWRLESTSNDTNIRLKFNSLNTELDWDKLYVDDERGYLIWFSGDTLPPVMTLGRTALLVFSTDGSINRTGFNASFTSVDSAPPSPLLCGGTVIDAGYIQSPNYPQIYPTNIKCSWRLLSKSNDYSIRMQFNDFLLEYIYDFVDVYDERNISRRYTGNVTPPTMTLGKAARIEFFSDRSNVRRGFRAEIMYINITSRSQCMTNDTFWCTSDRKCISSNWQCDGYPDCTYREDELSCASTTAQTTVSPQSDCQRLGNFWCSRSIQCIPASYRCDYNSDCIYGEDEANCPRTTLSPQSECQRIGNFWCSRSLTCISLSYRCNSANDCIYGEDEANCLQTSLSPQSDCLRIGAFWCSRSLQCVPMSWRCNNYYHCAYGEDEADCQHEMQQRCQQAQRFWCGTSRQCINSLLRCDAKSDCLSGDDEQGCANSSTVNTTAIAAGSVCGIIVFFFLVIILIRVTKIRRARRVNSRSSNCVQGAARPSAPVWSEPATYASQFEAPNSQLEAPNIPTGVPQEPFSLHMDQYAPPSYDATIMAYANGRYVNRHPQFGPSTTGFTATSGH